MTSPGGRASHWHIDLGLPGLIVILDQITKAIVRAMLPPHTSVDVIDGFLSLTHVRNTGAAFGILDSVHFPLKTPVLSLVALAGLIAVGLYARALPPHQVLARFGLALILGGAAGNLIDRVVDGAVVDFVDVYWGAYHFWAFNVADSAITIGVILMLLDLFKTDSRVSGKLLELDWAPIAGLIGGPITLYTYGVLLAAAYILGLKLAMVRAQRIGLDQARVLDLGIYIIISALVGAKLLLLFLDFRAFTSSPAAFLTLVRAGGVFYGGLILAVGVALVFIRRAGLPLWTTCDVFAPGIALGHVVGRFGCFFAGCCYGKETTVPWAITFTNPLAAENTGTPLNVPLHPTQLYEAGAELTILALLLATERKGRRFPGRTFWLYLLLYAISRFVIEMYRGDPRGIVLGVSTSQFISLILAPLAVVMLVYLSRRTSKAPESKRAKKAA